MTTVTSELKVYDNGGETYDRYTVVFAKQDGVYPYYGMSTQPIHPWGFCQYGESRQAPTNSLGKKISFKTLPLDCQKIIESYMQDEKTEGVT